jgi:hypothetical protein
MRRFFLRVCIIVGDPIIRGGGVDPINWFNTATCMCACLKLGPGFQTPYVVLYVFPNLR